MSQLPLGIGLREGITFDNFCFHGNREAQHALLDGGQPFVYLWGPSGSGKSHLLQALGHRAARRGETSAYLPLAEGMEMSPGYLQGLENLSLVCIDDIDRIARQPQWEEALFHLYNRIKATNTRLVLTASDTPANLPLALSDLRSRLSWGLVLRLTPLDDDSKLTVLQQRARTRGMELPAEVARYLLARVSRDMKTLLDWLDRLDEQSMIAHRRLTIPFVRNLLPNNKEKPTSYY